ncbi:MAG: formate dehydrogenase accessory sulfurtransferase FdhD [Terriglobia bacterium]
MARDSVTRSNVLEWKGGRISRLPETLASEEPLQIRIGRRPLSVTLRTPGDDHELVAGLLFAEGIIRSADEIASLRSGREGGAPCGVVRVELQPGVAFNPGRSRRNFLANSSCGLCGKVSFETSLLSRIERPNPDLRIDPEILCGLPQTLKSAQVLFGRTGGLHAAALFEASGKLIALKEDVGRHNAVDKAVGWALVAGRVPLRNCILMLSGRGGFEIIQKSLVAGLPAVACVSAASSMAVDLARRFGQTLVGFLREPRFIVYSGETRLGIGSRAERGVAGATKGHVMPSPSVFPFIGS